MPACLVITDAPTSDQLLSADGTVKSRVQIAKQGTFKDPRYGTFSITQADFDKWLENFAKFDGADGRVGLAGDEDHAPEKKGETKAVGWIKSLDQMGKDGETSTPTELWAEVEWTPLGVELIEGKIYAYISPSYVHNYQDEEGRAHGTKLQGWGLTNRPFLTMAAVTLSRDAADRGMGADEVEQPSPDSPGVNPKLKKLLDDLRAAGVQLADDATEDQILEAAASRVSTTPTPTPAGDQTTLAQQAAAAGMVLTPIGDHTTLAAQAAAGAAAAAELKQTKFDTAWQVALDGGQVTPAVKEHWDGFYEANSEKCLAALAALPKVVNTLPAGKSGRTTSVELAEGSAPLDEDDELALAEHDVDDDRLKVAKRVEQMLSEDPEGDYIALTEKAATELGVTL